MGNKIKNRSVEFFDAQFQRQVQDGDYQLNPFETLALNYLKGEILDLGAGIGNLSLEAARRGHTVLAVEASPTAVTRINRDAEQEGLPVTAIQQDIEHWNIDKPCDTIVCIGLLMFFRRDTALKILSGIQDKIKPGGIAIINVLIEGTSFMGMFDQDNYYLFPRGELERRFNGWTILESVEQTFPAPEGTVKNFLTLIARKTT